jgi:hypothetical protein
MKERLTLNRKEQNRVIVFNQVETKQVDVREAAALLNVSERQAGDYWRLIVRKGRRIGAWQS